MEVEPGPIESPEHNPMLHSRGRLSVAAVRRAVGLLRFGRRASAQICNHVWAFLLSPCIFTLAGMGVAACAGVHDDNVRDARAWIEDLLRDHSQADRWRRYLLLEELEQQLEMGPEADSQVVTAVRKRFGVDHPQLEQDAFIFARYALDAWLTELAQPSLEQLPALAERAREELPLPSDGDVARLRERLRLTARQLDRLLATFGSKEEGWRAYLRWHDLQAQIADESGLDPALLEKIGTRFEASTPLVRDPIFRETASTIRQMARRIRAAETPAERYHDTLDDLAKNLRSFAQEPTAAEAHSIAEALGWLQQRDHASALLTAVRRQYSRPNLFLKVSSRLVQSVVDIHSDVHSSVSDYILGTSYSGTSHHRSRVGLVLVPDFDQLSVKLLYGAVVRSNSVGVQGAATVRSSGRITIRGQKEMVVNDQGIVFLPSSARARSQSEILGFSWGRLLGRRTAIRRAYEQKPRTEQIVAQRAERRVMTELNRRAFETMQPLHRSYVKRFRVPLMERGAFPGEVRCLSTRSCAKVALTQASPFQLAAAESPREVSETFDLLFRLHESFLVNLAESYLGGRTLHESEIEFQLHDWIGNVPDGLKTVDRDRPWSVTFSRQRPLTVEFDSDQLIVHIRLVGFAIGDKSYPGMKVTAKYALAGKDKGIELQRYEKLAIERPGSSAEGGQRWGARQQIVRSLLRKRFDPIFTKRIELPRFSFPDESRDVGIQIEKAIAKGGWLVVGGQMTNDSSSKPNRPLPARSAGTKD